MGRRPGSKNKPKIIVDSIKDHVKSLNTKRGKTNIPKHALRLNDWLYITCDSHCWKIVEVNNKYNPTTGEKYPDKSILYATTLRDIIKVAVNYGVKVPGDVLELTKKVESIYKLIDTRIPPNIKPIDLFKELTVEDAEE